MERIQELFERTIEECIRAGIPLGRFQKEVYINNRAIRRWGACKHVGTTRFFEGRRPIFRIELSARLAEYGTDSDVRNTLAHELLHTCDGCLNHGSLWNRYARKMNETYGYHIKSRANGDEMEAQELHGERHSIYRYEATCVGCGERIYRMRRSKFVEHPEAYRCRRCGGAFRVVQLPR